jgi:hypothetical protein
MRGTYLLTQELKKTCNACHDLPDEQLDVGHSLASFPRTIHILAGRGAIGGQAHS